MRDEGDIMDNEGPTPKNKCPTNVAEFRGQIEFIVNGYPIFQAMTQLSRGRRYGQMPDTL